jgi:hypothetical protein
MSGKNSARQKNPKNLHIIFGERYERVREKAASMLYDHQ